MTENDRTNPLSYAILIEKKGTVLMEPIKIQKVIDYIEAHLTEELSYKQFAAMVAVSEADLQRSFKMITGVTISDYIRYRRLSCAAVDLKNNHKVLDAAFNYGYQTAESFTKAFKQYHGCTPMEAKDVNQAIRYFNPLVVKLAKRGGNVTECRAERIENADTITAFYNASDESSRLKKNRHSQIEFLISMKYLQEVIPENSRILDCCAGTGIYAFALAKQHRVVAGDLSEKHIAQMKELQKDAPQLEEIHWLDARHMDIFEDESFDVVLCMGALYHLFSYEDRMNAIRECVRLCKKGGILVFAYLNKWGNFYNGMINNLKPMDLLYREFDSGNHEDIFFRTTAEEVNAMCQALNLICLRNIGVDHLAFLSSERIDAMSDEEYAHLLDYQLKATQEPNIAGASLHGLWIGRK